MNPPLIAVISKEWKQRMQLIALALAGVGCWFLYDGIIAYPKNNERAMVYFELRDTLGDKTPELEEAWKKEAAERGWKTKRPKKIYNQSDLVTQIVLGIAALLGSGAALWHYFRSLPQTTRLENGVIHLPEGKQIALSQVRTVSKSRWNSKGIADLTYEAEPGKTVKFLLDDYKFIGAAEILAEVEKVLTPPEEVAPEDTGEKI